MRVFYRYCSGVCVILRRSIQPNCLLLCPFLVLFVPRPSWSRASAWWTSVRTWPDKKTVGREENVSLFSSSIFGKLQVRYCFLPQIFVFMRDARFHCDLDLMSPRRSIMLFRRSWFSSFCTGMENQSLGMFFVFNFQSTSLSGVLSVRLRTAGQLHSEHTTHA